MIIEDKFFEVKRNEEEHKNNECHKEIKRMYEYYKKMGVEPKFAIRLAKWQYQNVICDERYKKGELI